MPKLPFIFRAKRRLPLLARYGLTTGIVAAFAALRFALEEALEGQPFLLFCLPVFLCSMLLDRGSGLYATVLCAFLGMWLWIPPYGSLAGAEPGDLVSMTLFVGIGAAIALLTESLRQAVERIAQSEREKDLLLQEIHHRIRNDLQMTSALVRIERREGACPEQVLEKTVERITILGRVYSHLTQHDGRASVPARALIDGLVAKLHASLTGVRPITVTTQADTLELTAKCATALGLMINELVTNAFKYAFPDDRPGCVTVCLRRQDSMAVLIVQDDGIGLTPADIKVTGLGGHLVCNLAAQYDGTVEWESQGGTRVVVHLPLQSILAKPAD